MSDKTKGDCAYCSLAKDITCDHVQEFLIKRMQALLDETQVFAKSYLPEELDIEDASSSKDVIFDIILELLLLNSAHFHVAKHKDNSLARFMAKSAESFELAKHDRGQLALQELMGELLIKQKAHANGPNN